MRTLDFRGIRHQENVDIKYLPFSPEPKLGALFFTMIDSIREEGISVYSFSHEKVEGNSFHLNKTFLKEIKKSVELWPNGL